MKLEDFKSGQYKKQDDYNAFLPSNINKIGVGMTQNWTNYWQKLIDKLEN